ncbi:MAG: hypothetical protein HC895_05030 [Leptolyngbyaceae cyanobacterium SM1_3_5]|nr:hypothetical protein [Leptolyngbyaceae cyanobacterium SM1_3_5]
MFFWQLSKWCYLSGASSREIIIITTIGNRTVPETEQMLGCFINDVILRSVLSPAQTGLDLIHQLRDTVNEAIEHKDIPLQQVVEQTKRYRTLDLMASVTMSSTAQSFEQLPNWEIIDLQDKRSQWENLPSELYDDTTPLEIYVDLSKTIRITVNYSVEYFTEETVDRLFSSYREILNRLVTHPKKLLSALLVRSHQACEELA